MSRDKLVSIYNLPYSAGVGKNLSFNRIDKGGDGEMEGIIEELEKVGQVRDVAFIGKEGTEECACLVVRVRDFVKWKEETLKTLGTKNSS